MDLNSYTIGQWLNDTIGGCFPFFVEAPVGEFVVYDNIRISYASTKDSVYVDSASFRLSCVAKTHEAAAQLSDGVIDKLNGQDYAGMTCMLVSSTASRSEVTTNQFIVELYFEMR